MNIEEMIAVLEAAKRGEKIEVQSNIDNTWHLEANCDWAFDCKKYRIAPKKMTLVERLRHGLKPHCLLDMDDVKLAADRIEWLETKPLEHFQNVELIAELMRRMK